MNTRLSVTGIALLAACSSSGPLHGDGGARTDATGTAGQPSGTAGGGSGTTGGSGASGVVGTAGASGGAGTAGASGSVGAAGASGGAGAGGTVGTNRAVYELRPPTSRDLDLLFMIDNSSSMLPLQQKLIAAFPVFINSLKALPGGLPNLHIAVVSSSMGAGRDTTLMGCPPGGDQGIFQAKPLGSTCASASLTAGQSFIITGGAGGPNFTGDVSDVFACIAPLGDQGCGFEHQFASVLRALGGDGAAAPVQNTGFLRSSALLQIILVTNEDDCSAPPNSSLFDMTSMLVSDPLGPLQSYRCNEFGHLCGGHPPPRTPAGPTDLSGTCVSAEDGTLLRVRDVVAALKVLKADPSSLFVAAIAGPPNPYVVGLSPPPIKTDPSQWPFIQHSCMSADGANADPGVRLQEWVDDFGGNGAFASICSDGLEQPIQAATAQVEGALGGSHCLDPKVVAGQCTFVDHVVIGGAKDVNLPLCAANPSAVPCWTLTSSASCPAGHLVTFTHPAGATVTSTTATCPLSL